MKKIQMKKTEVQRFLRENLEKHVAEYKTAKENWQEQYKERLNKALTDATLGNYPKDIYSILKDLDIPVSYEEEYVDAIEMLSFEERDTVELDATEFKQYIKDDWDWKQQWAFSNSKYMSK